MPTWFLMPSIRTPLSCYPSNPNPGLFLFVPRYHDAAHRLRALVTKYELAADDPLAGPDNLPGTRPHMLEERRAAATVS